jgi:hypothetical protein
MAEIKVAFGVLTPYVMIKEANCTTSKPEYHRTTTRKEKGRASRMAETRVGCGGITKKATPRPLSRGVADS